MSWFKGITVWLSFEDYCYYCDYGDGMRMKLSHWHANAIGAKNYYDAQGYFIRARQTHAVVKFGSEFMELYMAEYDRAKKCRAL